MDAGTLGVPEPPRWPSSYMAKGIINLPYAEIGEPFDAWFDNPRQRSRIDYYSGKCSNDLRCCVRSRPIPTNIP